MAIKNLTQQPSGYMWRLTVPKDLTARIGKKELRYALKCRTLSEAKRKAKNVSSQVKMLFKFIRANPEKAQSLDQDDLNRTIRLMVKNTVEELENTVTKPVGEGAVYDRLDSIDLVLHDYRKALAMGDYAMVQHVVDDYFTTRGAERVDRKSEEYRQVAAEFMRAHTYLLGIERDQAAGNYDYKFKNVGPAEQEKDSETLAVVVEEYWQERADTWSKRTVTDYIKYRDTLLNFLGPDVPIHSVNFEDGRAFKAYLRKLKGPNGQPLSVSRVDGYLGWSKQLFQFAMRHNHIEVNPFDGLITGQVGKQRADKQRSAYTKGDLRRLFMESKEYTKAGKRVDYLWLPLVSLYTGMRLEEVAQLDRSDVKQVKGVWCFDVNDDGLKSVKTGERRLVPVHDTLIDLGFIEYVQQQATKRLFGKFKRINDRYGHTPGQWYSRFKRRVGFGADKTFHSFRHTVATRLAELDVPDLHISQLLGHASDGQTKSRYIKKFEPKMLKTKVVDRLEYGLDHSAFKKLVSTYST